MQAFISGGSGFIGSHLIDHLLKKSWRIRALVHKSRIHQEEKIEVIRGDISDFESLRNGLKGTDVLFHLAAALGSSLISEKEFYRINTDGTETILEAAREAVVKKIIHFSSAGVLGIVKSNEIAAEDYLLNPRNIYDRSKLEGEKVALRFAREGMNLVVIRPGWVYGPGDRRTFKLIKAIQKRRFILPTKGKILQTPVYIQDLIKGILLSAERGRKGEIYHLAGREVLTVREIVETIASSAGRKIPSFTLPLFPLKVAAWLTEKIFSPFKKEAPLNMSRLSFFIHPKPLSIRKAEKELGYSPEVDFKKGMALTLSWYREYGWL